MKKFLILALALVMALSTSGCITTLLATRGCAGAKQNAESVIAPDVTAEPVAEPSPEPTEEPKKEASLIGSWTLTTMENEGMTFNAADLGAATTFDFREDGTVEIVAYGDTSVDPYTFIDNAIVITEPTGDVNGVYDPETDTIRFEQDGVTLTLVRTESLPEAEATEEPKQPKLDAEAEELTGEWSLTKAKTMGMELPVSSLGIDMLFTFNADGSASMTSGGETYDGMTWTVSDGVLVVNLYDQDQYEFVYDGSVLTLHEESSDVDLIFEKN